MALTRRRMVNPTPAILALVNPKKRGKKMATKKRKSSSKRRASAKRRNPVNPVNPTKRRATKRRSTRRVYAKRRNPINPTRRRRSGRRRSRRNPVTGVIGRAVPLVLSTPVIALAAPFTAQLVGRFAPQIVATPLGAAGITFGTAWGISALMRMVPFLRRWSDDMLLAGAVVAGGQVFSAYLAPALRLGGSAPANGMGRRWRPGMNGIGVMTSIPPGMAALPAPPNNNGMQGVGVMTAIPPGVAR